MTVVAMLKDGPVLVRVHNTDNRNCSFVDFMTDGEIGHRREVLLPGQRHAFKVTGKKYTRVISPARVNISVEKTA